MINAIIVLVLAIIVAFAVKRALKNAKGGCCGSNGAAIIPEKKLAGPKLGEKIVHISGMHCDHCVASVKKALNAINGVSAQVSLNGKRAIVSYDREISDEVLQETVEKLGFQVEEIN